MKRPKRPDAPGFGRLCYRADLGVADVLLNVIYGVNNYINYCVNNGDDTDKCK